MAVTTKTLLSAFNSVEGKPVKFDDGTAIVAFAEDKSAYGRTLRDLAVVALSGRWRNAKGIIISDNGIEDAIGVPVRHPRFRLKALTDSGLKFLTNTDITDNAAVWAHVVRIYNSGKIGRDLITETAKAVRAVKEIGDKRTMWLATAVPKREVKERAAQPPTGVTPPVVDATPVVEVQEPDGELIVPENRPVIDVKKLDTAELLSLFHEVGDALSGRFAKMLVADRLAFRENILLFVQATKPKSGSKPKVPAKAAPKAPGVTVLKVDTDTVPGKALVTAGK